MYIILSQCIKYILDVYNKRNITQTQVQLHMTKFHIYIYIKYYKLKTKTSTARVEQYIEECIREGSTTLHENKTTQHLQHQLKIRILNEVFMGRYHKKKHKVIYKLLGQLLIISSIGLGDCRIYSHIAPLMTHHSGYNTASTVPINTIILNL